MGYSTRPDGPSRLDGGGGLIKTFTPDDTDDTIYLIAPSLSDMLDAIEAKWGFVNTDDIEISAENIHTDCIGYDLYDPSDYTDYTVVTLT